DGPGGVGRVQRLKQRVYRLELTSGPAGHRSVVLKRLEPGVAERVRLVAERWLPALGLGDRCPRLLAVAADAAGATSWHAYEDLGDETLASDPTRERVTATVDLIAQLHTRGARHAVLPDVRRYGGALGFSYFTANVHDAIAALEALVAAAIEPPPEQAGVTERLLERLVGLGAMPTASSGQPWRCSASAPLGGFQSSPRSNAGSARSTSPRYSMLEP